ncbi:MAG: anaerobic ribonucleoside-triphosphate reductase [Clostridia bacterium]|nr:anaerobic ribonucleoside-triphosphate reductase [Clostridia bacterium]
MKIIKRDGTIVEYNPEKIRVAIGKANNEVRRKEKATKEEIDEIIGYIEELDKSRILVEDIQDIIEQKLMEIGKYNLAKQYITYRYTRALVRKANTTDQSIKELIEGESEYWNSENANKNAKVVTTQRDYLAGITSTDITRRFLLPEDVVKAHDEGIIHFHDADYFAQNALTNCELINLDDMLQNGTIMNGVMIEKPHRFITACTIATQIILAVTSSTYGGATVSLSHLAPFVKSSYDKYYKKYKENGLTEEQAKKFAELDTKKEVADGVQTFNYQVNSMTNTNGQAPFLSVTMYLGETEEYKEELALIIEEFLKERILGFKNEKGVYITPAFPKLLYVLEEDNVHEESKYWYLTKLAAECTAKRLVPDYISEKMMKQLKKNELGDGECYPCMGCRSFLTPDRTMSLGNLANAKNYQEGKGKYYGRFNQGVVSINLVDVALSSGKDQKKFWDIYEERLELCHKALQVRHERLSKVTSDIAPILWQHGALARLPKGASLEPLLHNGYSTISLGYAGLYECVKYMTDKSHTDNGEGKDFAVQVMQKMNDKCQEWKAAENIDYSVYGTPIESTTYKFSKCLKERFGVVEGITDKNYITNSYHVPVFEEIDAFSKLKLESEFQKLSPGGAISYVETPNLQNNLDVVVQIIQYIYDNIMYAELNTKSDYCQECGFTGEILIDEDLEWYCPECGNRNHDTLNVARRTCGYIGSNFWNKGRTQEIKERVLHIDNKDYDENEEEECGHCHTQAVVQEAV